MQDTNTEIELKLALVKGSLARTRRAIGDVHLEETAIEDVYFDTPDASLRRRGLVLRLRRDGDRWLQTLKAASNGHSVVPVRGEWEVALPARSSARSTICSGVGCGSRSQQLFSFRSPLVSWYPVSGMTACVR